MTISERIQSAWKEISLIGTWVITIAGSFLLPLPNWISDIENKSYTQFIYFIATIMAGFVLIYTFVNKNRRTWLRLAVITFILLIGSFLLYNIMRSQLTRTYENNDIIIGNEYQSDYQKRLKDLETTLGFPVKQSEILYNVGGDPTVIWTEDSISRSKWILIGTLLLSFSILSIFLISFVNVFLLFQTDENKK